jgi:hypothetical protein
MTPSHLIFGSVMAVAMVLAGPWVAAGDPPSGTIDPPPGPLDYVEKLPANQWVFGQRIWQGITPCTSDFCEAAFNAQPLFVLVQKEKYCCGGKGYSITFQARLKGCPTSSYYIGSSDYIDKLSQAERAAYLARRVSAAVSSLSQPCNLEPRDAPQTAELSSLWR